MSAASLIEAVRAHALSAGLPVGYAVTVGVANCAALTAFAAWVLRANGPRSALCFAGRLDDCADPGCSPI